MSSKLVRKGLELVCGEKTSKKVTTPSASGRTGKTHAEQVSHVTTNRITMTNKEKRRRNNVRVVASKQKKGLKRLQGIDYTEQNLKYFKNADWKVNKDTYEKVIQHQAERKRRKKTENEETGTMEPDPEDFDFEFQ